MTRFSRRATWTGAVLGALTAFLAFTLQARAFAWDGSETEEFHQTYPLSANGRIELQNINGPVQIKGWDRNAVKVDAIKRADSKHDLDEVQIKIDSGKESLSIRTEYARHEHTWTRNDPGSVEYVLMVPRNSRLDDINLVNGDLEIQGVGGEVRASCVNGRLRASSLSGRTELSTVNGNLEADFDRLSSPIEVSSVNAKVLLTLPSDAKADIEAGTVSGSISNDFGIHVANHKWVGHELNGELGGGGTRVRVNNVNGRIEIRHANDNKPLSPAKNMDRDRDDDDTI
jgi:putative adhesin